MSNGKIAVVLVRARFAGAPLDVFKMIEGEREDAMVPRKLLGGDDGGSKGRQEYRQSCGRQIH